MFFVGQQKSLMENSVCFYQHELDQQMTLIWSNNFTALLLFALIEKLKFDISK